MKTECACHQLPGDYCLAERPRYFPRQIITAEDLTLEQDYFRNKLRRHNRLLHGWGVVCGALVCPVWKCQDKLVEPWKVTVQPGYILGPYGDEILIECARTIDLRKPNEEKKPADRCGEPVDPWCEDPCADVDTPAGPVYLAVKYKEIRNRPVRVQPLGCGCDDQACEYSRYCDGYEFGLLTACPTSHEQDVCGDAPDLKTRFETFFKQCNPDCPPCPEEPWVVLAKIDIGSDGQIKGIDNCACRRLVISTAAWWWKCTCGFAVQQETIELQQGKPRDVIVGVTGTVKEPIKAYGGPGITITKGKVNGARLELSLEVSDEAQTGDRWIIITDAHCSTASIKVSVRANEDPRTQEETKPRARRRNP